MRRQCVHSKKMKCEASAPAQLGLLGHVPITELSSALLQQGYDFVASRHAGLSPFDLYAERRGSSRKPETFLWRLAFGLRNGKCTSEAITGSCGIHNLLRVHLPAALLNDILGCVATDKNRPILPQSDQYLTTPPLDEFPCSFNALFFRVCLHPRGSCELCLVRRNQLKAFQKLLWKSSLFSSNVHHNRDLGFRGKFSDLQVDTWRYFLLEEDGTRGLDSVL
mmetsp:Transcript_20754/g.40092  ORF Transcript_20754/g.40092 Transcript_20754/m.40092 type:complete len:222 (+) Transcript_20754:294-959(+)